MEVELYKKEYGITWPIGARVREDRFGYFVYLLYGCDRHGAINRGRQGYGMDGVYINKEWIDK